jgi:uncharacterized repeat protein (TIGR01451 family)
MSNRNLPSWLKRISRSQTIARRRPAARPRRERLRLEPLEDRFLPSVAITSTNNNGNGYAALDFNQSGGYVPPDTNGAAGPTNYVETVNQTVAIYSSKSTGASHVSASLSTFWFTTGGLPHADGGSGLSDPVVSYNNQIGRFIVADQDVDFNTHVSRFDVAVSKSSSPTTLGTGDWYFFSIVTTESGFDADYPGNFGYNHDATVFTLNMFGVAGGGHCQVISLNNANLANGTLTVFRNDLADFSDRPATMHDSVAGDPMWLMTEHGDNLSIDVIKMTNVLSSAPTFTYTNFPVASYTTTAGPKNPNGTTITTNIDGRIQKVAEANHVLVGAHSVGVSGSEDDIQWYAIDVSGATPTLQQQGRVSGGANTYLTYPAIDINSSSQIGLTYMRSGNDTSTDYMSMDVTGRNPGDASGTMQTPIVVPAGAGQANYADFSPGRAGDLGGINVDPGDGTFWASNEFANTEATANWGTAVANFTLTNPLPSTDMAVTASGPSSVTAGTNATYTITITNNGPSAASGVVLSDALPAGSTFVSMTQTGGTDGFTLSQSGGSATETATGTIASGSSDTFSLTVFAPSSLGNGATFNNTSSVSASNPDPNPSNNSVTVTGTVVNNNPNADVGITVSGSSTMNEGGSVTYNITVTNAGPAGATGVVATNTLPSIMNFTSATTSQGTFSVLGGVVTFNIGSMAANATVTATVTAKAIEDGAASDNVSVASTSPDPNLANNSSAQPTTVAEPSINVSAPIRTRSRTLTNFAVATFTHASGVEPTGAFSATINWGDGTTSPGAISLSGTTYTVRGSHTYSNTNRHTISTTVVEVGNSVVKRDPADVPGTDLFHFSPDDDDDDNEGAMAQQSATSQSSSAGSPSSQVQVLQSSSHATEFTVSSSASGGQSSSNSATHAHQTAMDQAFSLGIDLLQTFFDL